VARLGGPDLAPRLLGRSAMGPIAGGATSIGNGDHREGRR